MSCCTYAVLAGPYWYGDRFYDPLPCSKKRLSKHHHRHQKGTNANLECGGPDLGVCDRSTGIYFVFITGWIYVFERSIPLAL
jgi:hypothetical protein